MADPSRPRPSWQRDPCPSWCVVEHQEDDLPADRVHDSVSRSISVMLGNPLDAPTGASELILSMSRRCDDFQDWVFVGEPERSGQHLSLDRESASRLASELHRLTAGN